MIRYLGHKVSHLQVKPLRPVRALVEHRRVDELREDRRRHRRERRRRHVGLRPQRRRRQRRRRVDVVEGVALSGDGVGETADVELFVRMSDRRQDFR